MPSPHNGSIKGGVLALDEPTTNLDAANIRGLAEALSLAVGSYMTKWWTWLLVLILADNAIACEALAALIEARRAQSRFQLVLITHDEVRSFNKQDQTGSHRLGYAFLSSRVLLQAFVNRLAQLQVCDWFYRIHKDEARRKNSHLDFRIDSMLLVAFGSSNHIGMFPAYSSQLQSPGIWMLKDREAKDSAFRGLRALTCSGPHLITGTGVFRRCGHCYQVTRRPEKGIDKSVFSVL